MMQIPVIILISGSNVNTSWNLEATTLQNKDWRIKSGRKVTKKTSATNTDSHRGSGTREDTWCETKSPQLAWISASKMVACSWLDEVESKKARQHYACFLGVGWEEWWHSHVCVLNMKWHKQQRLVQMRTQGRKQLAWLGPSSGQRNILAALQMLSNDKCQSVVLLSSLYAKLTPRLARASYSSCRYESRIALLSLAKKTHVYFERQTFLLDAN